MGIGLGVTGFPYYGCDIAGYMSQFTRPSTKELWFRWAALGALTPVMRTRHGKSATENWSWERDAETTAHFKRWAGLHFHPCLPHRRGRHRMTRVGRNPCRVAAAAGRSCRSSPPC
jgi:alpha-glucosidase (family GH31 glycosyl hydrolase)